MIYLSCQDTMIALQALTAIAKLVFSNTTSVTVTVSDPNGSFTHTFTIDSSNALVTQIAEVVNTVKIGQICRFFKVVCILFV